MRLIDADKAIEVLEDFTKQKQISPEEAIIMTALAGALKSSSVIPTEYRQSGHWAKICGPDDAGNIYCECSNCHMLDEFSQNVEVPFCWHCGTKMGGVVDATD